MSRVGINSIIIARAAVQTGRELKCIWICDCPLSISAFSANPSRTQLRRSTATAGQGPDKVQPHVKPQSIIAGKSLPDGRCANTLENSFGLIHSETKSAV